MRKALLIFSTPFVVGGLAWVVGAADNLPLNNAPASAQSTPPRKGTIQYFSRSGKGLSPDSAAPANADPFEELGVTPEEPETAEATEAAEAPAATQPAAPQRYVRNRSSASVPAAPKTKNYYHDLFDDADAAGNLAQVNSAQVNSAQGNSATGGADRLAAAGNAEPADDEPVAVPATHRRPAVITAKHEQASDDKSKKQVQQVGHDAEQADADVPAPKAAPAATRQPAKAAAKPIIPAAGKTAPAHPAQTAAKAKSAAGGVKPIPTVVDAAAVGKGGAIKQASARPPLPRTVKADKPAVAEKAPGELQTPSISLRWVNGSEVNVGQECKCGLVIRNHGQTAAHDVTIEAIFPRSVRLISAEPFPEESKERLVWNFENIAAGEEKTIDISMIPSKQGEVATSASVRLSGTASNVLRVEEPRLHVAVAGPHEVLMGESATQVITVSNPGTGVAQDVVVHAVLPNGLEHPKGKKVEIAVGSLAAGESREIRLALAAVAGGNQSLVVEAKSGSNLAHQAESQINVAAPKVELSIAGPSLRYVNRHAHYTVTVRNSGTSSTSNIRVQQIIPEGLEFVKADKGGKHDRTNHTLTWFLGHMDAGQTTQLQVELAARQNGVHVNHVMVTGDNGVAAEAKVDTRVDGTAALVMEVVDVDDPVEVNTETAYEIRIRNTGTKAAQNLSIVCELPQGVELIGTDGPTDHFLNKGLLFFKPLGEVAPKQAITYRVKVTGKVAGNLRFRARMTSSAAPEPLIVEELTKFYAD